MGQGILPLSAADDHAGRTVGSRPAPDGTFSRDGAAGADTLVRSPDDEVRPLDTPPPNPELSVLLPTYNSAAFLGDAVDSVLTQAGSEVEVVVIDDGSTDDTPSILRQRQPDPRLRYIRQENQGPGAARNHAMSAASGRYFMFLDSDDDLLPGCVAKTLSFLHRHPEVEFFFPNYELYDMNGTVAASGVDIWRVFRTIPHEEAAPGEWLFTGSLAPWIIRYGSFMHTSGLTVSRAAAERAGPFRTGYFYGDDDDWFARVLFTSRAGYLDEVLTRKRNHPASIIHDPSKRIRNIRDALDIAEIQRREYEMDRELRRDLDQKIRELRVDHAWHLSELPEGRRRLAILRHVLADPTSVRLYRILVRALLLPLLGRRGKSGKQAGSRPTVKDELPSA